MGKLIGIDLGTKRTGIAETDDLQIIASPLETVSTHDLLDYLEKKIATQDVEGVVIGLPTHLDGSPLEMTEKVLKFEAVLKRRFPKLPVVLEDENFTSRMAMDALVKSGASKKKRRDRSVLDKVSAALILQSYLEKRNL